VRLKERQELLVRQRTALGDADGQTLASLRALAGGQLAMGNLQEAQVVARQALDQVKMMYKADVARASPVVGELEAIAAKAEPPTPAPAQLDVRSGGGPGGGGTKVAQVYGQVEIRQGADQGWLKCERDSKLADGTEVRTGPRASVTLITESGQTIVLDRLTSVTVGKLKMAAGQMKFFRMAPKPEVAPEDDVKIQSPSSTIIIRG
jgi:hypothetical protein